MGSSNSKESSSDESRILSAEAERRRKELEEHGVLLPPSFGVIGTPSQKGTGNSTPVQHRLLQYTKSPVSYVQYLQETDLSTILLKDHMIPGVWISAQAAPSTTARVSAFAEDTVNSQIFVEQNLGDAVSLQLRAETDPSSQPHLSASWQLPDAMVFANATAAGHGWIGAHVDKSVRISEEPDDPRHAYEGLDTLSRNIVNAKLGAWMPWNSPTKHNNNDLLHGYAAVNAFGGTAAIHGALGAANRSCNWDVYVSANVSDVDQTPLQITLERNSESKSSLAISQVLAFDRLQWNVLEDRAPKVRNTLAWTVRMESNLSSTTNTTAEEPPTSLRRNHLELGAAWQLNRSFAVKAVVDPQEQSLKTAFMFKRWKHPRVTCSVLHKLDRESCKFIGLGIELETSDDSYHAENYYYNHHPKGPTAATIHDDVPATRVVLLHDTKSTTGP